MPFLNWKNQLATALSLSQGAHPDFQTQIELGLDVGLIEALSAALSDLFSPKANAPVWQNELRVALPLLPHEWVLFWKAREAGNRLLLAHPEPDQWVVTVALEKDFAQAMLDQLLLLKTSSIEAVRLSEIGELQSVTNMDLVIKFKKQ